MDTSNDSSSPTHEPDPHSDSPDHSKVKNTHQDSDAKGNTNAPSKVVLDFSDPEYGLHDKPHEIHSNPTWSLEENQSNWTGWAGAGVVFSAAGYLAYSAEVPQLPGFIANRLPTGTKIEIANLITNVWEWRHQLIILGVFFAMFLVETLGFKVHRRHFDFTKPRNLDARAWGRISLRWIAVCFCLLVAAALYCGLDEYAFHSFDWEEAILGGFFAYKGGNHFYGKYILFFIVLCCSMPVICIPYFWMVERYAKLKGPADEFLILGRCLESAANGLLDPARRSEFYQSVKNPHVHNLFRGLLVKFFFIPLMLIWCVGAWHNWETLIHEIVPNLPTIVWSDPYHVAYLLREFHGIVMTLIIIMDLTLALVGYLASVRLLDTHITSAEPTLLGWFVALLCYPPFNMQITSLYIGYGNEHRWQHLLGDLPLLSILASLLALSLMGIYAWATIAFGMRFSNLTNRGILCKGPYKYVRHPAYISKNSSWWFGVLPFMNSWPTLLIASAHLFTMNVIYGLRAWTEEKHLMREPHYREYCKKVKWRFIPGIL